MWAQTAPALDEWPSLVGVLVANKIIRDLSHRNETEDTSGLILNYDIDGLDRVIKLR